MDGQKFLLVFVCLFFSVKCSFAERQGPPPPFQEECVQGKYPPIGRPKISSFVINLDLPADQRWNEVGKAKAAEIKHLFTVFKGLLLSISSYAQYMIDFVDKDFGYIAETLPYPFGDELRGISKASGLPLGETILYNIFYEIFTFCTSIIAQDSDGKLYHARNLDFGLFMGWESKNHTWEVTEALRPGVITLDWQRGGKTVFRSVNFAGYIGILTGMKQGIFTLTMNERFSLDGGYIGIIKWILGDRSASWMSFLTRATMENATSYKQARQRLSDSKMLAPAYFILGGNQSGEACVITRDREKAVDVWDIGTRNSTWYILETNYDHWKKPLFLDDRRTPANRCMQEMTQKKVGFPGIFDVLSSRPVLNKLTTYTALMQVSSGKMETYLQYCPDPCSPW